MLSHNSIHGQVVVVNRSSRPFNFAAARYEKNDSWSGFVSVGWHHLEPGAKFQIFQKISTRYVYFYCIDDLLRESNGPYTFFVDPENGFRIKNADLDYHSSNPSYVRVGFDQWDTENFTRFEVSIRDPQ